MRRTFLLPSLLAACALASSVSAQATTERVLKCAFDEQSSLILHTDSGQIYHAPNVGLTSAVHVASFQTFRCPYCYAFKGSLNGQTIAGYTHASRDEAKRSWRVYLDLQIADETQASQLCTILDQ